jgi:quinohemoprotein ethanol dehydrogenase
MVYAVNPDFQQNPGRMSQLGLATTGHEDLRRRFADEIAATTQTWLMAYDPVAHREVWRVPYPRRGSGGTLVTAGDVVFQGTINTTFAAYHARTGAKLWEEVVQQVPIAAAMTYAVGGVQYVAVNAGWGGGLTHQPASNDAGLQLSRTARLLVYRLGGEARLPPIDTARAGPTSVNEPPADTADAATVTRGRDLYAQTCAQCHGGEARGGIKDLRMMSPATHAEFMAIVRGGTRAERGMVSFADTVSEADAQAIHSYLIRRANEDWNGSEVK